MTPEEIAALGKACTDCKAPLTIENAVYQREHSREYIRGRCRPCQTKFRRERHARDKAKNAGTGKQKMGTNNLKSYDVKPEVKSLSQDWLMRPLV